MKLDFDTERISDANSNLNTVPLLSWVSYEYMPHITLDRFVLSDHNKNIII